MSVIKTTKTAPTKPTAMDLKLALLVYFRFKRQWICVDECMQADVIADTGKHIVEVEVKVSRQDLLRGEEKKRNKHLNYELQWYKYSIPNKYYFCVPIELKDTAIEYVYKLNPRYGVMVFDPEDKSVITVKSALILRTDYNEKHRHEIAKRASCKLITLMQKEHARRINEQ